MSHFLYQKSMPAPFGKVHMTATDDALVYVCFDLEESMRRADRYLSKYYGECERVQKGNDVLQRAEEALRAYFAGQLRVFDLPIEFKGTAYQHAVWTKMATIPYGEVVRYQTLTESAGSPKGTRSVGAACGANPLSIVVPCHRVLGTNRSLTGFGGGLETKKWLLELEGLAIENSRFQGEFSELN